MIIDFKDAVEGEFYNIEESIPLDDSLTGSRGGRFLSPATLKGWYTFSENTLAVNCVLTVEAIFDCDRCGAPTTVKYKVPVEETFFKDPPDEYSLSYDDEIVDLDPVINDRVVLASPSQVLCRKDCKGLCSKCGKNLNEGECNCNIDDGKDDTYNPFSVLKNMNNNNSGGATNGSTKV